MLSAMATVKAPPGPDRHPLVLGVAAATFLARPDPAARSRTVYGQTLGRLITDLGTQPPIAEPSGADLQAFLERHSGQAVPATWNLNLANPHGPTNRVAALRAEVASQCSTFRSSAGPLHRFMTTG
jgi:hypothetical protein